MLQAGAAAPEVRLESLGGLSFRLAEEVREGPVVLAFFKISCPTCQFTLPFLERLHQGQSPATPRIFGVSQDTAAATVEFNRHFGIRFPVLLDPAAQQYPASNAYAITSVPSLFLIGPSRRIEWELSGFHKEELELLGTRFGQSPFTPGERVPAMRPG